MKYMMLWDGKLEDEDDCHLNFVYDTCRGQLTILDPDDDDWTEVVFGREDVERIFNFLRTCLAF